MMTVLMMMMMMMAVMFREVAVARGTIDLLFEAVRTRNHCSFCYLAQAINCEFVDTFGVPV